MGFKVKDHYFKKAKKENFLARSIYKLDEIDRKFKLFSRNMAILDLGYHPGSWCQYVSKVVGDHGVVVGVDIKAPSKSLSPYKNVRLFEKDAFEIQNIKELGVENKFGAVISDMAPNTTGIKSVDQDRSLNLVEKVFQLLEYALEPEGCIVVKVFDSHGAQAYLKSQKKRFRDFQYLKPQSTRSVSKEFFVIGKGFLA